MSIMAKYNATPPTLEDGAVEFLQLDVNGNLKTTSTGGGGGGDASAANQLDQIAAEEAIQAAVESLDTKATADPSTGAKQDDQTLLLEDIKLQTQIGAGWFGKSFKKILFSDMTPSGIDISALAPAGMKCVAVMGSRQTLNTQTIYLEAEGNAPGVYVDLDFGRNYVQNGVWKTIGPLTTANSFPLWVVFS